MKHFTPTLVFLVVASVLGHNRPADAQLRWPSAKKEALHVRLVALALADPRSSFFTTREVFVAEKEIGHDEWSLIKLVYTFLPYQPRLSESGLDYSIVHEFSALRNATCDETLAQMTSGPERSQLDLKYAADSPAKELEHRRTALPCYETTADDYSKAAREPIPPPPPPSPSLSER
ncbi:MAG: hypothetical protein JO266_13505 [Acidobacteria bacterium]|nr:hypothetical protein [Acidobacteriota bacterium]MBV8892961.1 hypothetical protein [Acidobacteriota bacterium]